MIGTTNSVKQADVNNPPTTRERAAHSLHSLPMPMAAGIRSRKVARNVIKMGEIECRRQRDGPVDGHAAALLVGEIDEQHAVVDCYSTRKITPICDCTF